LEGLSPEDILSEWLETTRITNEIFSQKLKTQE
jgi:hypothetical protein